MRGLSTAALVILVSLVRAESAGQADWSGGPGVPGPVGRFGTTFDAATGLDWSVPAALTLSTATVEHRVDEAFDGAISIACADIDGDGDTDIAGAAFDANRVAWWENSGGGGSVWVLHVVTEIPFTGASSVVCADLDDDGDVDLLGAGKTLYGVHALVWWENEDGSGTAWAEHGIDDEFAGAHSVAAADIDGDGIADPVGASIYRDELAWWSGDTTGTVWTKHTVAEGFDGAWAVDAADMDGDGDQDVVGCAYYADAVSWFENSDGAGSVWIRHDADTGFDGAYSARAVDVDLDGDMDILGAAALGDEVTWWENREGTLMGHVIDSACDGAFGACAADIDGDGDMDVLAASYQGDVVDRYLREGTSWSPSVLAMSFDGAAAVDAADIDGNGISDPVGAAMGLDAVSWWATGGASGDLVSSILDTGTFPVWGLLDWTAVTPEGSTVAFQVRASDDPSDMGVWSETLTTPGRLSDVLADGLPYVQYRALLATSKPGSDPVLWSVEMSWIPVSVGGGSSSPVEPDLLLLPVCPNPAEAPVIRCVLPSGTAAVATVFDLSGRIVWQEELTGLPAGLHEVVPGGLLPGVYVCRLVSGGSEVSVSFTVAEQP